LHVTADEDVRSRGFSSRRVLCASHKNEYVLFSCVFFFSYTDSYRRIQSW
jgi:hypothetical protein